MSADLGLDRPGESPSVCNSYDSFLCTWLRNEAAKKLLQKWDELLGPHH